MQAGIYAFAPVIFALLALAGSIISGMLLWYQLDQHNPLLQQICSTGKKTSCNAILQSNVSKIAGMSWGTIGFAYFFGELLFMLITGVIHSKTLFVISWLNVLALPYTFFSIYYQWKIAKQWCVLCLCVQGVLALQFIIALLGKWHSLFYTGIVSLQLIFTLAIMLAVPFIAVTLLMPALEKAKENKTSKRNLQRLKRNPQIFEALLAKQNAVTEPIENLGIVLGSPGAKHKIIKVSSPYCEPCAKAHIHLEELLENNPEVQIQIIYITTNDKSDTKILPVEHLLAIAEKNDEQKTKRALNDWYLPDKKDYDAFATKYPMNGELKMQDKKIENMYDWCAKMNIVATPTFFVNGYQLPEMYNAADLKYFLTL